MPAKTEIKAHESRGMCDYIARKIVLLGMGFLEHSDWYQEELMGNEAQKKIQVKE